MDRLVHIANCYAIPAIQLSMAIACIFYWLLGTPIACSVPDDMPPSRQAFVNSWCKTLYVSTMEESNDGEWDLKYPISKLSCSFACVIFFINLVAFYLIYRWCWYQNTSSYHSFGTNAWNYYASYPLINTNGTRDQWIRSKGTVTRYKSSFPRRILQYPWSLINNVKRWGHWYHLICLVNTMGQIVITSFLLDPSFTNYGIPPIGTILSKDGLKDHIYFHKKAVCVIKDIGQRFVCFMNIHRLFEGLLLLDWLCLVTVNILNLCSFMVKIIFKVYVGWRRKA